MTIDLSDSPTLPTMIRDAISTRLIDVHTALPGRVEAYVNGAQTADIRPQIKRVVRRADGTRVAEELPVIPCVPVQWPRGGGFFLTMPLAPGDFGMLIFSEYSLDRWRSQGEAVDPADERRHGLSGAVFWPGVHPSAFPLADASATELRIGKDGGYVVALTASEARLPKDAVTFLARADRVLAELTAIKTAISGAAVLAGDGGSTFKANIIAALATFPAPVASDTVKGT